MRYVGVAWLMPCVVLVGCGNSDESKSKNEPAAAQNKPAEAPKPAPARKAPSCDAVVAQVAANGRKQIAAEAANAAQKKTLLAQLAALQPQMLEVCNKTPWSPALRQCLLDSRDKESNKKCFAAEKAGATTKAPPTAAKLAAGKDDKAEKNSPQDLLRLAKELKAPAAIIAQGRGCIDNKAVSCMFLGNWLLTRAQSLHNQGNNDDARDAAYAGLDAYEHACKAGSASACTAWEQLKARAGE